MLGYAAYITGLITSPLVLGRERIVVRTMNESISENLLVLIHLFACLPSLLLPL